MDNTTSKVEIIGISEKMRIDSETFELNKECNITESTLESQDLDESELKRKLKARHLTMISLGGVIGHGLFLSSGGTLAEAGPAGALMAYAIVGFIIYWVTLSLGEMATYIPVSGSFTIFCRRFVDESFGAAVGWNYWAGWSIVVASELTALPVLMAFWTDKIPAWAWSGAWLIVIFLLNLAGTRVYGETEYWLSMIKILTIIIFIVVGSFTSGGLIGNEVYGLKYWSMPGAFANGPLGVINALVLASFSMQGAEMVGIAAGESANPRKDVPIATRNVFYRLVFIYIGTMFVIGMIIPYNDPLNITDCTGSASVSPFTIVFQKSGLNSVAHVINAVVLVTVVSCANSGMYVATRTLCTLSQENIAPSKLSYITSRGVPIYALIATTCISLVAIATSFLPGRSLFFILVKLSGVSIFISWGGICCAHYRFRKAYLRQKYRLSDLPFVAHAHPFGDLFSMAACIVVCLVSGRPYFSPVNILGLVGHYGGLILFLLGLIIAKLWTKSEIIPIDQIDLDSGRVDSDFNDFENELTIESWYKRWKRSIITFIV
ncbi:amino acid permease/ SLC12A domain-containing protein [Spinellus fusiger]|nr:amino acid permease/ SLC12A domain-containing protein [Spinellus fusiger]